MKRIISGLRLAAGIVGFIVGLGFALGGLHLVLSTSPPTYFLWSARGWTLLILGVTALLCTAESWYMLWAGCALLGTVKAAFSLVTGANIYSPHEQLSRLISFQVVLVCVLIVWFGIQVQINGGRFSVLDRIAATLSLLSFLRALLGGYNLFILEIPLALSLILLFVAGMIHKRHSAK